MRTALVLLLLLLAGCTQPAETADPAPATTQPPGSAPATTTESVRSEPLPEPQPEPVEPDPEPRAAPPRAPTFLGTVRRDAPLSWNGTCPCGQAQFALDADAKAKEWLEVTVRWDGTQTAGLAMEVTLGQERATGLRGFDARRVQLWQPADGLASVALEGRGAFEARAELRTLEPAAGPRLPNLVTMVPEQVGFGSCDEVETLEQSATRCLRLGNGIGNTGHGPLQVRLTYDQGALGFAGLGRFVQEILQEDGTMAGHEVHTAQFHPTHAHWHYEGVASFSLHALDADGRRTEQVAAHHKAGFCLLDWGEMDAPDAPEAEGAHAEQDCLIPMTDGWTMGMSPGWYDFYVPGLTDQYVDAEGVPDGLYELVSEADGAHTLDETDESDNLASVVVRITGETATVVEERGWYQVADADQT